MANECPKCRTNNPDAVKFCGECGTRLESEQQISFTKTLETPVEGLTRGTLFAGRYEIIEKLGEGGMGAVYRVEDTKVGEEVALKLIKPEVAAHKKTVERFRRELKTARQITHKNVCRMHDLNEDDKTLYITMEYVRGEDLKSLIRRTKHLAVGTAVSIAGQIAEGLTEAHRLGVIHRDLKPNNIMIDKEGRAKIMDFGIARSLAESGTTAEGVIIGTPDYMSPEQGEGKAADERSDIYSLGIILYEMLTGQVPFVGDTALSVALKHQSEAPPAPRALNANIPVSVSRLILRCLEKDKSKRPQSAGEFLLELAKVEDSLPAAERSRIAKRPTTPRTLTIQLSGKRLFIPVAALIVVAAVITGVLKFLPKEKGPIALSQAGVPVVAIFDIKNNTGDQSLDIWRYDLSTSLIFRLSESRFIRVLDDSQIRGILQNLNLLDQNSYSDEDLRAIAMRGDATHIVRGKFSRAGETIRVDLALQDASTLEIIKPIIAEGTFNDFDLMDNLVSDLRASLRITAQQEAEDVFRDVGEVYTESPEAWSHFVQGWRLHVEGKAAEAIPHFEKAIAADPEFASAYGALAQSYYNTQRLNECATYIQRAFDLREKVSERERLSIEAHYYKSFEDTWDKAIETYNKLNTLYPGSLHGHADLAFLYYEMEEWDKGIEHYEILRRYKYENIEIYVMLPRLYLSKGRVDKAKEVLEDYLANISDNGRIHRQLALIHLIQKDFKKAEEEMQKAYTLYPEVDKWYELFLLLLTKNFSVADNLLEKLTVSDRAYFYVGFQSDSYTLQGRLEEAKASSRGDIERWSADMGPDWSAWLRLKEAALLEKKGDLEEALVACGAGLIIGRETGYGIHVCQALFRQGIIQLKLGDLSGAEKTAEELKLAVENGPAPKRICYYDGLLGLTKAYKKDTNLAIQHFEKALNLTPVYHGYSYNPRYEILYYLGETLEQSGQWDRAKKAYEDILSLFDDYNWRVEIPFWVKAHYKLAAVLEQSGDTAGAVRYFREFLDYWQNADPGLPEVDDASRRLAALTLK